MKRTKAAVYAAATAMVAAAALIIPSSSATASNDVDCGHRQDVLKVKWHYQSDEEDRWDCYANSGLIDFRGDIQKWTTAIRSGNNDIYWWAEGERRFLPRGYRLTFPNAGAMKVDYIKILSCKHHRAQC